MKFRVKEGASLTHLDPRVEAALPTICKVWEAETLQIVVFTAGRDGVHGLNSLHYEGRALDCRTRTLKIDQINAVKDALKAALGPDWDVVIEADHLHIELDRRADRE